MRRVFFLLSVVLALALACETGSQEPQDAGGKTMRLVSTGFSDGGTIPKKYTGDGPDLSPPLVWEGVPDPTKSFVLIMDDPDAPVGTWDHWVVYDLPGQTRALPEAIGQRTRLPKGTVDGTNSWGRTGYGGPAPPPGKPHRYFIKLYALSGPLGLEPGARKEALLEAMKGKILAEAQLWGTYGR